MTLQPPHMLWLSLDKTALIMLRALDAHPLLHKNSSSAIAAALGAAPALWVSEPQLASSVAARMASGDDFVARIMGIAQATEQRKQEFQAQLQAIAQARSYAQQQQQTIHQGQLLYPSAAMG